MQFELPNIVVTNLHRRYTGVSATIRTLLPHQRKTRDIQLVDWSQHKSDHAQSLWSIVLGGFSRPRGRAKYRILHCRRDIDMIIGIILRDLLRQKWKLIFTSAQNRHPRQILKYLINKMDCIIATCDHNLQFLEWHSVIINHGVDTDRIAKRLYSIDQDSGDTVPRNTIGIVGRIRHQKGVDLFVDVMIEVLPSFSEYKAVIVGRSKPSDEKYLEAIEAKIKLAKLENRIVFIGEVSPEILPDLYKQMAVCLACSRGEGYGLIPLEAMANGVPVITTAIGAWPQIVTKDVGSVVEIDDLPNLVNQLKYFLSNPKRLKQMAQSAPKHVVKHYSVHHEAHAINKVYQRLMLGENLKSKFVVSK